MPKVDMLYLLRMYALTLRASAAGIRRSAQDEGDVKVAATALAAAHLLEQVAKELDELASVAEHE